MRGGVFSKTPLPGDVETEDKDGDCALNGAESFSALPGEEETEDGELDGVFWDKLLFNILAGDKDGDRISTLFRCDTLGEVDAEDSTFLGETSGDEAEEGDFLSLSTSIIGGGGGCD
jgi:hypothetical protein